jgi:hypothetical protein
MSDEGFIEDDYYEVTMEQRQPTPESTDSEETIDISEVLEHTHFDEDDHELLDEHAKQFNRREAKKKEQEARAQTNKRGREEEDEDTMIEEIPRPQTPPAWRQGVWEEARMRRHMEDDGAENVPLPKRQALPPPVPPKPKRDPFREAKEEAAGYFGEVYNIEDRMKKNTEDLGQFLQRSYYMSDDEIQRKNPITLKKEIGRASCRERV